LDSGDVGKLALLGGGDFGNPALWGSGNVGEAALLGSGDVGNPALLGIGDAGKPDLQNCIPEREEAAVSGGAWAVIGQLAGSGCCRAGRTGEH